MQLFIPTPPQDDEPEAGEPSSSNDDDHDTRVAPEAVDEEAGPSHRSEVPPPNATAGVPTPPPRPVDNDLGSGLTLNDPTPTTTEPKTSTRVVRSFESYGQMAVQRVETILSSGELVDDEMIEGHYTLSVDKALFTKTNDEDELIEQIQGLDKLLVDLGRGVYVTSSVLAQKTLQMVRKRASTNPAWASWLSKFEAKVWTTQPGERFSINKTFKREVLVPLNQALFGHGTKRDANKLLSINAFNAVVCERCPRLALPFQDDQGEVTWKRLWEFKEKYAMRDLAASHAQKPQLTA